MVVNCLKVHTVSRNKIDGIKPGEFMDRCEDSKLYLLDIDPYFGKEMNFKVYRELSGLYDIWIDAASRKIEDVMDILIFDAEIAVLSGIYFWDELSELLELTDNVAMKSIFSKHIVDFVKVGGKIVILPKNLVNEFEGEKYIMTGKEVCPWKH